MEVLIAVVRLRDHGFTQKNFLTPENFDLLVMEDTLNATNLKGSSSSSPSSSMKKSTRSILSCRPQRGEDTVEAALRHIAQVHKYSRNFIAYYYIYIGINFQDKRSACYSSAIMREYRAAMLPKENTVFSTGICADFG